MLYTRGFFLHMEHQGLLCLWHMFICGRWIFSAGFSFKSYKDSWIIRLTDSRGHRFDDFDLLFQMLEWTRNRFTIEFHIPWASSHIGLHLYYSLILGCM